MKNSLNFKQLHLFWRQSQWNRSYFSGRHNISLDTKRNFWWRSQEETFWILFGSARFWSVWFGSDTVWWNFSLLGFQVPSILAILKNWFPVSHFVTDFRFEDQWIIFQFEFRLLVASKSTFEIITRSSLFKSTFIIQINVEETSFSSKFQNEISNWKSPIQPSAHILKFPPNSDPWCNCRVVKTVSC